jgi:hypothetical protein
LFRLPLCRDNEKSYLALPKEQPVLQEEQHST